MTRENSCNYITCPGNCLECEFPDFVLKTLGTSDESKYIISNLRERKHTMEVCGDNRFEIIEKAKKHLLESTNIDSSKEMDVLDSFLYRCWQMGWLDKYNGDCETCIHHETGDGYCRDCGTTINHYEA